MQEKHDVILYDLQKLTGFKVMHGPFSKLMKNMFTQRENDMGLIEGRSLIHKSDMAPIGGGWRMEATTDMLKIATEQLKEARKELEQVTNEMTNLANVLMPKLDSMVRDIRDRRMASVTEMTAILGEMRQVHKFFIEASYEREMKELERFVALCQEIKKLKAEGIFDAICDSAIRMAVKEEHKHEG